MQIHATVVSIDGHAVVLRGPSGSGKSDLALRLIEDGAVLVSDDRCDLDTTDGLVTASPPSEIAGLLEVRGLGIFRFEHSRRAPVVLVIDLVEAKDVERLPEPRTLEDWGPSVPVIRLTPFEASAAGKVRIALRHALGTLESVS